ncbi:GTP cyclohydrolase II [Nitzschia inconspicua]|uniref:GTP cyclohydrolase II n=1 Tax=Nitzschia inconspicua TaxID=303405 RepID=A0A9K3L2T3_9STRA|nr:GTP cyclohydrolase II [Nitzschia inconspicua]
MALILPSSHLSRRRRKVCSTVSFVDDLTAPNKKCQLCPSRSTVGCSGGGTHRGYSLFRHYHLMCTLALSLVVLCTSEAFLSSTTTSTFISPRGGATLSINDATASTTANSPRNLYMEDGLDGEESVGATGGGASGDYNLGMTPSNGKSKPAFVKKNGATVPPSKIRLSNGAVATTTATVTASTATKVSPSIRNGLSKKAAALGMPPMANVATAATARPPIGMAKASNGVVINKAGFPNGGAGGEYVDHPIPAEFVAETNLPTDVGQFRLRAYRTDPDPINEFTGREPSVIYTADKSPFGKDGQLKENVPIRIHDQCLTSEVFRSQRCDCSQQLKMALQYIAEHGGAIIYLQQEGRGIGLANKVAAYALQDAGMDTVDANLHLGFAEDQRHYGVVPSILKDMNIGSIRLMTNNPRKVARLRDLGIRVENTLPMVVPKTNPYNHRYLEAKHDRMNHTNLEPLFIKDESGDESDIVDAFITEGEEMATNAVHLSLTLNEDKVEDDIVMDDEAGVLAKEGGYCFGRQSVEDAIRAVKEGKMVVVVDDMNRENEGDLIMAADACTPEDMAFITRYSSGVICIAMEGDRMDKLKLPPMVVSNEDPKGTAFTVTVDATREHGITTGISAADRSKTVNLLADPSATATDFARPGHIFPLRARDGGVLERDGHTEAAVDLSALAGRDRSGILCEIVSEEKPTEMMRLPELKRFSKKHGLVLTSIVDIAQYRREMGDHVGI